MSADDWEKRVDELGSYCASIGVPWLTVTGLRRRARRRARRGPAARRRAAARSPSIRDGDGRRRFAEAMNELDPPTEVTEATVERGAVRRRPMSEPDLLVVLGPPTQLPPSLVWELAYAELVFIPVAWSDFGAGDLAAAVVDFAGRRRRFGGLDDE